MHAITFSITFIQEIHKSYSRMALHSYQIKQKYPEAESRGHTTALTNKKEIITIDTSKFTLDIPRNYS